MNIALDVRKVLSVKRRFTPAQGQLRQKLLDRRDSLVTLIDVKQTQLSAHFAEFDELEQRLAELEGLSK